MPGDTHVYPCAGSTNNTRRLIVISVLLYRKCKKAYNYITTSSLKYFKCWQRLLVISVLRMKNAPTLEAGGKTGLP